MHRRQQQDLPPEGQLMLSIAQAAALLGVGRGTVYAMIGDGRLRAVSIGRRRVVARDEVERVVAELTDRAS